MQPPDQLGENNLTLRLVPLGIEGNEIADDWAKSGTEKPGDSVPREYLCETSFARMARMALLSDDERAAKAVLSFLRKTKVGQMATVPPRDA